MYINLSCLFVTKKNVKILYRKAWKINNARKCDERKLFSTTFYRRLFQTVIKQSNTPYFFHCHSFSFESNSAGGRRKRLREEVITALPRFYGIRTSNRRRVQRHYRFFGSRGILALLVVNRETEKSYRPTSTFSTSLPLRISTLPLRSSTADLAPLSRHKSGKSAGKTKRDTATRHHRIADTLPIIATSRVIRRIGLLPFRYDQDTFGARFHLARRANPFAQKLKD